MVFFHSRVRAERWQVAIGRRWPNDVQAAPVRPVIVALHCQTILSRGRLQYRYTTRRDHDIVSDGYVGSCRLQINSARTAAGRAHVNRIVEDLNILDSAAAVPQLDSRGAISSSIVLTDVVTNRVLGVLRSSSRILGNQIFWPVVVVG